MFERNPNTLLPTKCYGLHSVEWLPGDYYLSGTLTIPDAEEAVINAEGARFHYVPGKGDAVVLQGMSRCRYRFGTIMTDTDGAALRVKPTENMPSLMSIVSFTGLIGTNQKGIGLCVDSTVENVCAMRFEGTDIRGFDIGIFVPDARPAIPGKPGSGKTDTNWYWCSYIRMCNTCIWEQHNGIDDGVWYVNVDASIANSVAVRTSASYGRWFIILGSMGWSVRPRDENNKTRSIILDPGARYNVMEVTPPVDMFAPWQDNSGNNTNVVMTSKTMKSIGLQVAL
ncbi:MAG: hypothetical protein A2Z18_02045 [Armatimonadetes bacterium RBG_16_58_9]|nr:MAG: hypothetical protein A2Z18_02045 [Armatimonadetes bacterium RBG_16_58_9]